MRQPGDVNGLDTFPKMQLGSWPTPVVLLDEVSEQTGVEVWAKLDEECGAWGGNKLRKLEYIFGEARRDSISRLVSWGAGTSNWAAALALHGEVEGFTVSLGLGGHIPEDYAALYEAAGTRTIRLPRLELAPLALAVARVRAGLRARYLPVGGSGTLGDIGSVHAGTEIATGVIAGELPRPKRVFVATGSSGTVAGLIVGLGIGSLAVPVTAVKVSDWPYATTGMVTRRISSLLRRLEGGNVRNVVPAPWRLEPRFLGPGYGKPTNEGRAAMQLAARDGLNLDPTYGAKAFAALLATARSEREGPYLFLHTSPKRPVGPFT
jgi:D-cysteine desulfhydrase